jgi:hypothetical protein
VIEHGMGHSQGASPTSEPEIAYRIIITSLKVGTISASIHRFGNQDLEQLSDLLKVTQLQNRQTLNTGPSGYHKGISWL